VILNWPMADNHAYLLSYWCLAVALALVSHDPQACLALNARLLIGLAFACATLWKALLSPDYLDGRCFRVLLLTDRRFEGFAQIAGGLTPELLESLRAFVTQHIDGQFLAGPDAPQEPTRFLWLASLMTWWTVVLESVIAVTFLWPFRRGMAQWCSNAALLLFCATTYIVAPVEGFGWLLIAMGVAQCDPARRKTYFLYLVVFFLIILYRDEWVMQLLEFFQHGEV
jgi:hypothetical protein